MFTVIYYNVIFNEIILVSFDEVLTLEPAMDSLNQWNYIGCYLEI